MSILKPLLEEEVPEEYRSRILFDSNRAELHDAVGTVVRAGKAYVVVDILCNVCGETKPTPVNAVRNWLRGRLNNFPGTHRHCKYTGRYVRPDGYVMVWKPKHPNAYGNKYIQEHILVMEESIGRYIDRDTESVHHINGDKADNRIENLQLRKKYHGKGQVWQCQDCGGHNVVAVELASDTMEETTS